MSLIVGAMDGSFRDDGERQRRSSLEAREPRHLVFHRYGEQDFLAEIWLQVELSDADCRGLAEEGSALRSVRP